jgi:tetratricopeptide (TPR) repeat protein
MELVKGIPITTYCDQANLPIEQRLNLFMKVCDAVQHAHQKGVIHRDLKPNNVLVTVNDHGPVPKVIDFGVAKATQARLTDSTLFTGFHQLIGTPTYMSPEQAQFGSVDVDTRSDVYSLGVLLYELLTGTTPFDSKQLVNAAYEEMRRVIRDVEPPRPSTKLSTLESLPSVAARRRTEPRKLTAALHGELDWIVMRCLEKDRARRYETANSLCRDVERYLADEAVQARPPTPAYWLWKFARRNRLGVLTGLAVVAALCLGLIVASIGFSRSRRHARLAEQVAQFLKETLRAAGPSVARGRDATLLREVLDKTVVRIDQEMGGEPEAQGDLWYTLGVTYVDIGDYPRALPMFEHAVASYRLAFGEKDNPKLALALGRLGRAQSFVTRVSEGRANAERGLEMARACGDRETLAECLISVAWSLDSWGMLTTTNGPYLREALAIRRELGTDPVAVADCLRMLANVDDNADEQLQREALAIYREHLGPDDPRLAACLFSLGQELVHHRKFEEAASVMRETVDLYRKLFDARHPRQPVVLRFHVEALMYLGRWDEIDSVLRAAATKSPASVGGLATGVSAFRGEWNSMAARCAKAMEENPNDVWTARDFTIALLKLGRSNECERRCHQMLEISGQWKLAEAGQRLPIEDSDRFWRTVHTTEVALMLPAKGDDLLHACEVADALEFPAPGGWDHSPASVCKALAELRRGRFESAIQWSNHILTNPVEEEQRQSAAWFVQAMACANLGRRDAANSALAKGNELMNVVPREDYVVRWAEWEVAEELRREAAELFGIRQTQPATAPDRPVIPTKPFLMEFYPRPFRMNRQPNFRRCLHAKRSDLPAPRFPTRHACASPGDSWRADV